MSTRDITKTVFFVKRESWTKRERWVKSRALVAERPSRVAKSPKT
jgi:hypothetical protein